MSAIPSQAEERIGAAVALVSLDSVTPFYREMGLALAAPASFLQVVRTAIIANRAEFVQNPNQIPDIRARLLGDLSKYSSGDAANFAYWLDRLFVFANEDLKYWDDWWQLLVLATKDKRRWAELHLPDRLSSIAFSRLLQITDREALHAIADEIAAKPMSRWDIDIYSTHGFDDDENDPYNLVLATVKKKRFLEFMRDLIDQLSNDERGRFCQSANSLKANIESLSILAALSDPEEFIDHGGSD